MSSCKKFVAAEVQPALQAELQKNVIQHPALARVQAKLKAQDGLGVEEVVQAYSRMHHRHNRS